MTPPLNNAYLSSHSSLEKSGVHFGILGTFCVASTFQNERFSKTPNTAVYIFTATGRRRRTHTPRRDNFVAVLPLRGCHRGDACFDLPFAVAITGR